MTTSPHKALLPLFLLFAACSANNDTSIPVVTPPHNSISFHFIAVPQVAGALAGDTVRFSVQAVTQDSTLTQAVSGPGSVKWESSNPAIASIDQHGLVTGHAAGITTLRAIMYADTGLYVYSVFAPVATARIITPALTAVAPAVFHIYADLRSANGDSLRSDFRNLQYTSSDPSVAVVQFNQENHGNAEDTRVYVKGFGTTTITITALEEHVSGSITITVPQLHFRTVASDGDGGQVNFTCGLTTAGHPYCWGTDLSDQAFVWYGQDPDSARGAPVPAPVPTTLAFDSIAVAYDHACGLTAAGQVWCWGNNSAGQLGDGTSANEWINAPVLVAGGHTFTAIDAAVLRSCGVDVAGQAWCWGNNSDRDEFGDGVFGLAKVPIAAATGTTLKSISLARLTQNGGASCGMSTTLIALCWSVNGLGQVGIGHVSSTPEPPTPVASPAALVSVYSGGEHACGLDASGNGYCWGDALYGVLTLAPDLIAHPVPTALTSALHFKSLSVAPYQTCGLALDAAVWCWGNSWGSTPVQVAVPGTVVDLRASYVTDCAVNSTQQAWCWTVPSHTPVKVLGQP
jgi:Big-like domain-containing protein/Regulator of Chromosome Condensation (RCC1) repeat protein